jgi:hypothetical protein
MAHCSAVFTPYAWIWLLPITAEENRVMETRAQSFDQMEDPAKFIQNKHELLIAMPI